MTRGDILPEKTGNAGKYLKTDGNLLSWDTLDGSDIDLDSPPPIGSTTPNTGAFTVAQASNLRVNQTWDEGTGRLQVTGQAAVEGNVVAQDLVVQGGNNLLLRSQEFDDAYWSKVDTSIQSNTIIAPDGTLTGDKIIATTTNVQHFCSQLISHTSGTSYTLTCFFKAAEITFASLTFATGFTGIQQNAFFDLSTGTTPQSNATITPVGNGWYRCSLAITATATASSTVQIRLAESSTTAPFAGNDFNGAYIWGAQLE
jgi:hypothetical protein